MAEHTGQPLEVIERDTERDRFMDADQSLWTELKRYGRCLELMDRD